MKAKDFLVILLITICIGAIMFIGKSVLIPFVLAILIWYVVKDIRDKIAKTKLGKKAPTWLINVITSAFVFGSLFLITQILKVNITNTS
jgi:AI-2 transport protein TqsA